MHQDFSARISVFQELPDGLFAWFREAYDEEPGYIAVDKILTWDELQLALKED